MQNNGGTAVINLNNITAVCSCSAGDSYLFIRCNCKGSASLSINYLAFVFVNPCSYGNVTVRNIQNMVSCCFVNLGRNSEGLCGHFIGCAHSAFYRNSVVSIGILQCKHTGGGIKLGIFNVISHIHRRTIFRDCCNFPGWCHIISVIGSEARIFGRINAFQGKSLRRGSRIDMYAVRSTCGFFIQDKGSRISIAGAHRTHIFYLGLVSIDCLT